MKKILFVITKSNWGGAQRYVFDLATNLDKASFEPVVALGGTGLPGAEVGRLKEQLDTAGIRSIFVQSFMRDISLAKEFGALSELYQLFKKERPDVVHLNSSKAGGLGALAARLAGVPTIVFTAHGWPFWEKNRSLAWRALAWSGSWATMLLSHRVICISDYDLHIAQKMPFVGKKLARIYNGAAPLALGTGERIRSAFPPGAKIIGTIGELNKNKNQIALIEEARNNPSMFVAIVGDGELREYLQKKIDEYGLQERVKLLGFILQNEALPGFDKFVLPSIKEGLPYVLIDAKMAGLPIEASPVGGIPEFLNAKDTSQFSLRTMVEKTQELY